MKWIWGFLFLLSCSQEYGVSPSEHLANLIVDTATYETTTPTIPTRELTPPDDVDFAPRILVEPLDYDHRRSVISQYTRAFDGHHGKFAPHTCAG